MAILTFGSQSTSSDHSQCRLPSSPGCAARMFATMPTSLTSYRIGPSAARSFGPMSGSSLIIQNTRSMTVRNSFDERNSAPMAQLLPEPDERDRDREAAGFFVPVVRAAVVRAVSSFFAVVAVPVFPREDAADDRERPAGAPRVAGRFAAPGLTPRS